MIEFINDMSPNLVSCIKSMPNQSNNQSYGERTVESYELEYIISGEGYILVNGIPIPTIKGSLNFRRPGMRVEGIGIYSCIYIVFDINSEKAEASELNSLPIVFYNIDDKYLSQVFNDIINTDNKDDIENSLIIKAKILELFSKMFKDIKENNNQIYVQNDATSLNITKATTYIHNHFKEEISLDILAKTAGYSPYYFCRLFKKVTGWTPVQYTNQVRANHAKKLILTTDSSIKNIFLSCGFNSYTYFFRIFKSIFGVSPNELKQSKK